MSKIYIASSWRNKRQALTLAKILHSHGHEVDCFCDPSTGRYVAHVGLMSREQREIWNAPKLLTWGPAQKAFETDKTMLDWADTCILLLPCGNSAHIEAGYAVGQGKRLFIVGKFPPGQFDVMYGFADALIYRDDIVGLLSKLKEVA